MKRDPAHGRIQPEGAAIDRHALAAAATDWLDDLPVADDAPFRAAIAGVRHRPEALGAPGRSGRRVTSGLGRTIEEARWRAVAEAAERYCLTYAADRPAACRLTPGASPRMLRPERLLLVGRAQARMAPMWNLRHRDKHALPPPVDVAVPIDWIEADGEGRRPAVLVPAGLVLLGHPDRAVAPWLRANSAGVALGGDVHDALERALAEACERDAAAIWWYNRLRRPAPPIDRGGWIGDVARWLRAQGRGLEFLDLTHDLGVPVVAAVSRDGDGRHPVLATAAAREPLDAAEAALREMLLFLLNVGQLRATVARRGWSALDEDAARLLAWHLVAGGDHDRFLTPAPAGTVPAAPRRDDDAGIGAGIAARLDARAIDWWLCDVSRAEIPVKVVRAIVPDLRPTLARFAPGRLFDVPVALGWRRHRMREERLAGEPYPF
jgi:ribosomal protein S12 methylthiotransferase accessory factor